MTKISQYTAITTLANSDLMDISQDVGGGLYQSKSITYSNLVLGLGTLYLVEVNSSSDLPVTLLANTTYLIRGTITTSQAINVTNEGSSIIGLNRNMDKLIYTGTGDFISVTDVDFTMRCLYLSATDSSSTILNAINYLGGAYNEGRNKTLSISDCQIRDCYNVMSINGFDLVDFSNTLFWYVKATLYGCKFQSVSKLQFTSCELVRWFDESTIPTPSGYATTPMIELISDGVQFGFGAVNINGCVLHPQQTQDGLNISATSTTGFGTIASNTFINLGLTTGIVGNFDYNIQNTYIIQANQGLLNGNAKGTLSIIGNLNNLNTGTTNPQVLNEANVGGTFTNTPTFPVSTRVITSVPNCSFTYDNKNNGSFFVVISGTAEMTGDGFIACRVRSNGVAIPFSIGLPEIRQGRAQSFSFSVIGSAVLGDVFDVEFESFDVLMVSTPNDILVREFVLNGYQY